MSVDIRIQAIAIDAAAPDEQAREIGIPSQVTVSVTAGLVLPFAQAPGQPVIAPLGNVQFALSKKDALESARRIEEAANELPDESDLVIANDVNQADQFADQLGKFKGD